MPAARETELDAERDHTSSWQGTDTGRTAVRDHNITECSNQNWSTTQLRLDEWVDGDVILWCAQYNVDYTHPCRCHLRS